MHPDPPAAWAELSDPIGRFLDDERLEGKEDYLKACRQDPAGAGSRNPRRPAGYGDTTGVSAASRCSTRAVCSRWTSRTSCTRQGLSYDPATAACAAFGEGFEQCAMTWKAMVVPYLGLKRPADNIFELSVSGGRFPRKSDVQGASRARSRYPPVSVGRPRWPAHRPVCPGLVPAKGPAVLRLRAIEGSLV